MENKLKVLEIGPGNFGIGGRSVITWSWYLKWNLDKMKIDFLSCDMAPNKYYNLIKHNGGEFYWIEGFYNQQLLFKPIKKFLFASKIVKLNHYTCVHIHSSNAFEAFIYYLAIKPYCKNIFIHSHNTNIDCNSTIKNFSYKIKKLMHTFCRSLLVGNDLTFLACSKDAAKWMFSPKIFNYNQYSVIKNGIDVSKFIFSQEIRRKIRSILKFENKFIIGHIGRFTYQKNHIFLVDIFHEVYKKNQNSILLLIGKGELEKEVKDYVKKLGLEEGVYFYGSATNTNELYQAMDCFVFPSHFEGLGIVAIEAQAAGLRTLCADTVPKEVQVTELLEYMPLSVSVDLWAEKILSYNTGYKRKNMSAEIKKAGYDIVDSAKQLEELYLNLQKK